MKKLFPVILIMILSTWNAFSQTGGMDIIVLEQVIVGDDTLPAVTLEPIEIRPRKACEDTPELSYKLKHHTRKAYPYAIRVARIVNKIETELAKIEGKRARKKYLSSTQKLLKKEFKHDLQNLSKTQGKLLIKLVHRETGSTVYDLIGMYRSDFKANWWQFMAKRFDASIKDVHDADGVDASLEVYVKHLDQVYQRSGLIKKIEKEDEQIDLSVQSKKRKRKRKTDG